MKSTRTRSAGGIVIGDAGTVALVERGGTGIWLFPKGHVEDGETDEAAAHREIAEETGLTNLELLDDLGTYERYHINKDGSDDHSELKEMHLFLFAAEPHATLAPAHEISGARWVSLRELGNTIGNEADRAWFSTVAPRVREAIQRD